MAQCISSDKDACVKLVVVTVEGGQRHFEALHIVPGPSFRIANTGLALETISLDASFLTPMANAALVQGAVDGQRWVQEGGSESDVTPTVGTSLTNFRTSSGKQQPAVLHAHYVPFMSVCVWLIAVQRLLAVRARPQAQAWPPSEGGN